MKPREQKLSPLARALFLLISIVVMVLGICAIVDGYAPGRFTRFGYAPPLYGTDAKKFGFVLLLMGLLPLLPFCRNARQATFYGSVLGVVLVTTIFIAAYS